MFWKHLTAQKCVHEIKNIGYLLSIQETKHFNMSYNRCSVVIILILIYTKTSGTITE